MEVKRKDLDGPPLNSDLAALPYRTIIGTLLPLRLGLAVGMVAHSPIGVHIEEVDVMQRLLGNRALKELVDLLPPVSRKKRTAQTMMA